MTNTVIPVGGLIRPIVHITVTKTPNQMPSIADAIDERQRHRHGDQDGAHLVEERAEQNVERDHGHQDPERRQPDHLHPPRQLVRELGQHDEAGEDERADHDEEDRRRGVDGLEQRVEQPRQPIAPVANAIRMATNAAIAAASVGENQPR